MYDGARAHRFHAGRRFLILWCSKDMWEGDFDAYIFKHAIVEASTAVKGQCFRWLYRTYPAEQQFVYLDPDCRVYSDFSELRELLVTKPIVVCPHLAIRECSDGDIQHGARCV